MASPASNVASLFRPASFEPLHVDGNALGRTSDSGASGVLVCEGETIADCQLSISGFSYDSVTPKTF